MKVYIGPYVTRSSLYSIVNKLLKPFIKDEDKREAVADWVADSPIGKLYKLAFTDRKPKVSVKIDGYDTWGMDYTLSHMIHPMLVQLRKTKQGSPHTDDEDVPEHLRSTNAGPKEDEWDTDEFFHDRWTWILDEMIWAFNEIREDTWEAQYHTGYIDMTFDEPNENGIRKLGYGPKHTHVWDREGSQKHANRIMNGTRLFGKYYRNLWD